MNVLKSKSITIIFLFGIISSNLFSQINVYKPFPQVYGEWQVMRSGPLGPGQQSFNKWKKYIVNGDTSIGAYTYKKVLVANNTGNPIWNGTSWTVPYGPNTFCFAYRNDIPNKKVYYLETKNGQNKDTLWFNFNLNVGSAMQNTYAYYHQGMTSSNPRRIVSSIDSIEFCGTYHKRFNFNCPGGFETSLIEGIGFADRFDSTGYGGNCPFEPVYIYSTVYSTCTFTSIKKIDELSNANLVFPNPVSNQLLIDNDKNVELVIIYDPAGKEIFRKLNQNIIDVSILKSGLYLVKIKSEKGEFFQKFIKE